MVDNELLQIAFYQQQIRAYLGCSVAGCDLNLVQPKETICQNYHVEILLQPTDDRGLPQGRLRCLYETEIRMSTNLWSAFAVGGERLPFRLPRELLTRCHLRLTDCTMFVSDKPA
tara:strand:- start:12553 stop:12897 length:345 start_codon:yes stop_codon:yes gene_type:complete